ncbi:hypothetical protein OCT63_19515 [Vibrio sp. RW]|uniref:type IVB secretion system protein IcmW n=1 Tax=Vibrio sp. RW TaxID=2998833 RepID=UPI0022CD9159|nr:hypothetical protein [Vibrio sp. RW]MDA0146418.1 hypothetical protein [Vibrio sp. RW]
MVNLTFDKDWIDEYWEEVEPEVMQSISQFESKESWVVTCDKNALLSLNRIAQNLPEIANMPITEDVAIHSDRLIRILGCLPLKTSLAAFGWLGALSENEHRWNYIINVYANKVSQGEHQDTTPDPTFCKILIERLALFTFLDEFNNVFLNDITTKLALEGYVKRVKGETYED